MSDAEETNTTNQYQYEKRPYYMGFLFFAGILLPVSSLLIELFSALCANNLFDPLPTWWHVLFVAFVPITNFQAWRAIKSGSAYRPGWLGFANGVAIFISLFYAIIFAPITPLALIGLIFIVGILALAPILSLIAALFMRRDLRRINSKTGVFGLSWPALGICVLVVFAAITLAELPFTLTKIGITKAASSDISKQNEGIAFLKRYGDREHLLRLCYSGSGAVTTEFLYNFITTGRDVTDGADQMMPSSLREDAQRAFYRLTGKNYRQVPTPRTVRGWDSIDSREFIDDTNSTRINHGLSLVGSTIDGSVDGDAALGYFEWTMTFKNEMNWQQEAESQIQLPPNAVASRLTLWINGEEREAAFAKKERVIEAYNKVTATRRDPALLTVIGKDRLSLKCFPVQPHSEMKVRIGLTVPLMIENENNSLVQMPYFQTRNFSIAAPHSIWIESKRPLVIAAKNFINEQRNGVFGVRGEIKDEEMQMLGSPVRSGRDTNVKTSWTEDKNNKGVFVKQEIREATRPGVKKLVFVVDTSDSMNEFKDGIAETFKSFQPGGLETSLVLTNGNGMNINTSAPNVVNGAPAQLAETIAGAEFGGGADGAQAIETAWEATQSSENAAIIWIHGPQNTTLHPPAKLLQLWQRRPDSAPVYSLQVKKGRDVVEKVLNESNLVTTVPRFGSLKDDIANLVSELGNQKKSYEAVRTVEKDAKSIRSGASKETSQHLVRLWAKDQVESLLKTKQDQKAIELAVANQLVTSVSGAVVLETKEQYDQFGLKPVDSGTVPSIPEPHEYLLFAVVMGILLWLFMRNRKFRPMTLKT